MVLRALGETVTEFRLRELCECDDEGCTPSKVVEAANYSGYGHSFHANLSLTEVIWFLWFGDSFVQFLTKICVSALPLSCELLSQEKSRSS